MRASKWDPAHPRAVVLCEPSGPSAESGPSVEPDDGCTVHLVGLGGLSSTRGTAH